MKYLGFIFALLFLVAGCGTDDKVEILGYNNEGQLIRDRGLSGGDVCPMAIDEFAQSCIDAGYEVVYKHDCEALCSGKIAPVF